MSWRQTQSGWQTGGPTRAVNVDASAEEVRALCAKHGVAISALEELLSGGTRVVTVNIAGADLVRARFAKRLLTGQVQRTRWVANR